ncbi:uncharacterized protein [Mytilus edulis]|uniref:uncharacterized protein n=1 Tax=Mytilus edulis TaxID=6550 RepID=UPI0039F00A36
MFISYQLLNMKPAFVILVLVVLISPVPIFAKSCNSSECDTVRMPLISNNLKAPLVADLDVSALNTQLKDYIDDNIVSTFTEKMEDMVNKKLFELKNGMLNEYSSKLEKSHTRYDRKLSEMHSEYDNRFSDLSENQSENVTKFMENVHAWQNTLIQSMNEYSSKLEESHTRYDQKLAELYLEYNNRFSVLSENQSENVQACQNSMIQSMNEQSGYLQKSKIEYDNQVSEILRIYRDQTSKISKEVITNFTDLKTDMEDWKNHKVADLIKAVSMNFTQLETKMIDDMDMMKEKLKRFHDIFPENVRDCSDMNWYTGVHHISPDNSHTFKVRCETGGWTVIQKRFNGVTEFYRNWQDYETGFGDLNEEFWLGNKYIAMLTSRKNHQLRIDLEDWDGEKKYAVFKSFKVGDQSTKYTLTISGYSGNAGDSMTYHNNMPFSTYDRDNDKSSSNCADYSNIKGAWWYNSCWRSSLNGKYSNSSSLGGIKYKAWRGYYKALQKSSMMIKRT